MDTPVRVGVVGLGWWACDVHIPNLRQLPEARVAALCSRSAEGIRRGLDALGDYPTPACYSRYDELLAADDVEAVVLCTPNVTHGPLALAALRAGKHVLVEKPLATDPGQCDPIVAEAAERGLIVQVGVELRCSDVVRAMRRLMDEGAIGTPLLVRTGVWRQWGAPGGWRADPANSGGTFHELAIHYLDLLNALAPTPPAWIAAPGGRGVSGHDVSHALATIGYGGGVLGSLALCLFAAGSDDAIRLEVVGSEGRLLGEILGGTLRYWPRGGEGQDHSPRRTGSPVVGFPGSLESLAEFVGCVRTGRRPQVDAAEGRLLCRLCEAARRSLAAGGRREPVAPPA